MRNIEDILASFRDRIALTARERDIVRSRLAEAMRERPVTFSPADRPHYRNGGAIFAAIIRSFIPSNHYRMPALAIALILALTGGGTAYAAQGALPGDFLYPVKVDVNENVQQAFAFSDQAKADVNASLAAERLKEAAVLAAKGDLSTTTRATLETNLNTHLAAVSAHLAKLSEGGDAKAVASVDSKLESSLSAYADAFASLEGNAAIGTSTQDQVSNLLDALRGHEADVHASTVAAFAHLEQSDATTTAAELSAEATLASTTLAKAQTAFANASTTLSAGVSASATAHINDAANQLSTGGNQASAGNSVAAYASYQNSIRSSLSALAEIGVQATIGDTLRERENEEERNQTTEREGQSEDMSGTSTQEQGNPSSEGENHRTASSTEGDHGNSGDHGASGDVNANVHVNTQVNTNTNSNENERGGTNTNTSASAGAGVNANVNVGGSEGGDSGHGIGHILGGGDN